MELVVGQTYASIKGLSVVVIGKDNGIITYVTKYSPQSFTISEKEFMARYPHYTSKIVPITIDETRYNEIKQEVTFLQEVINEAKEEIIRLENQLGAL